MNEIIEDILYEIYREHKLTETAINVTFTEIVVQKLRQVGIKDFIVFFVNPYHPKNDKKD